MARMALSVVLITLALVASLWLLLPASLPAARQVDRDIITMPLTAANLQVGLQATSKSRIKITISNGNADHPLTLVKWDTPLDPRALDTGVLVVTDPDTSEVIPGPGLKLNRKLPPTKEDFLEIAPSGEVSEERELKGPWLPKAGQRVKVHAEGEWKALWDQSTATVKQEALEALDGDGSYRAAFRSDAIEVEM